MDFTDTFKSEVFRPVVTLVVPGAVAIGPYILVTGHYIPRVQQFWDEHPSAFAVIIAIAIIAAGLILEDIGIEVEILWDRRISKSSENGKFKANWEKAPHMVDWREYLKLELKDEIIGQRYLRDVRMWMKFELAMFPAVISLWAGLLWVNCIYHVWTIWGFILVTAFISILDWYLLYSSYGSVINLAEKRKLILEAMQSRLVKQATPKPG